MYKDVLRLQEYADLCEELGIEYYERKDYKYAEALFSAALDLAIECEPGEDDYEFMVTKYNNLATIHFMQDNLDEAEKLYDRSLKLFVEKLGLEHPYLPQLLHNMAELTLVQNEPVVTKGLMDCEEVLSTRFSFLDRIANREEMEKESARIVDLLHINEVVEESQTEFEEESIEEEIFDEVCVA